MLTARSKGRSLLAQGKPVITHGYFTGYGHVVVVTGFTGSYTVNDPAGVWSQNFQGGYPRGVPMAVRVSAEAAAFEAVRTSDGASPALWYTKYSTETA